MLLNFPAIGGSVLQTNIQKIKILIAAFFVRLYFSNLIGKLFYLLSLVCNSQKLQNVNLPQIIEHQTSDFFHTFALNFALAPVVLHPLQNGGINLKRVYCLEGNFSTPRKYAIANLQHTQLQQFVFHLQSALQDRSRLEHNKHLKTRNIVSNRKFQRRRQEGVCDLLAFIHVIKMDNPPRLAMLTAGCQCLKYSSFKNEIKCCCCCCCFVVECR